MLHSMVDIRMWTRSSSLHTASLEQGQFTSVCSWNHAAVSVHFHGSERQQRFQPAATQSILITLTMIWTIIDMGCQNSANQCTTNILCHKRCPYQLPWNEVSCINVNAKIRIKSLCKSPWLGEYTLLGRAKSLGRYALSGRANSFSKCALFWRVQSFSKYALLGRAKTSKTKSLG